MTFTDYTSVNLPIFHKHTHTPKGFLLCPWVLRIIAPTPRYTHPVRWTTTRTHAHTADMTERCAAKEDSVVARWRTPILFVQQPAFNHTLLSSLYFSPLFQSSTLFSCCCWQWQWRDFWCHRSSTQPPLLCVSESPLLPTHPCCSLLSRFSFSLSLSINHSR